MSILFARIDDRLIHGQVVEGWLPFLNATEVVIASGAVAKDKTRIDLMRLALPQHVDLKVKTTKQTIEYIKRINQDKKILLLTPTPCEILEIIESGVEIESVNVGGMHYSIGKVQIGRAVFMDSQDIACLKKIAGKGVKLEGRGVPTDKPVDVLSRLNQ